MIATDPSLNETDIEVYKFIIRFKQSHNGNSPSILEMVDGTHISSKSHAHYILRKLEDAGYLTMGNGQKSRGIQIPGTEWVMTDRYREPALEYVRN